MRNNKFRVSRFTELHICRFLNSSFRDCGFKTYKAHHKISFEEETRAIQNRITYLKKLQENRPSDFEELIKTYEIYSEPETSHSEDEYSSDEESLSQNSKQQQQQRHLPQPQSTMTMQHLVPDKFKANSTGLVAFRDDNVLIGEKLCSILTIYQVLTDARDEEIINLCIDPNDPSILLHDNPVVPTIMYQDYREIHKQELNEDNPEIFTSTMKKHMKKATPFLRDNNLNIQTTEYQLPFALLADPIDDIENTASELEKNIRTHIVLVNKELDIHRHCDYIYWKAMIDGEVVDCSLKKKRSVKRNKWGDAQTRASNRNRKMN